MKRKTKNPALLFIMTMFALFGMLSANANESSGSYLSGSATSPLTANATRQTFVNQIVNIDNESFENLSTTTDGGALSIDNLPELGESTITNSKFISNKATGYSVADSGAISIQNGVFVLKGNEFTNNEAMYGGAIYAYTGNKKGVQVAIEDCVFDGNKALSGGAIGQFASQKLLTTGGMTITNTTFSNNEATDAEAGGGAMFLGAESVTSISGSNFIKNKAANNGGAIITRDNSANNSNGKLDIINSTFTENSAVKNGGALDNYFYNSELAADAVTVKDSTFNKNTAENGGAIYNHGEKDKAGNIAKINVSNSTFEGNEASKHGGAIYNEANLDISGSTFKGNKANSYGGAIYNNTKIGETSNNGVTNISNSVFESNESGYCGGAIFLHNGELNIKSTNFIGNKAKYSGAIFTATSNLASLNIEDSLFENNTAEGVGAVQAMTTTTIKNTIFKNNSSTVDEDGAGALFVGAEGLVKVEGSTFEHNTSSARGGAISTRTLTGHNNSAAKLDIINSSFINNIASTDGGAIDNHLYNSESNSGAVTVKDSTFTSNEAKNGGAIYNHGEKDKAGNSAKIIIDGSAFGKNVANAGAGGAIYSASDINISNSIFTNNKSTDVNGTYKKEAVGGAIAVNGGTATIENSQFDGNIAQGSDANEWSLGGALSTMNGAKSTVSIKGSTFSNNESAIGGAVYNMIMNTAPKAANEITIEDSTFTSNIGYAAGGAIGNFATMNIIGSTFESNKTTKDDDGGGVMFLGAESLTKIENSTFNNNVSASRGGAISTRTLAGHNNSAAKLDVINSTFTGNSAVTDGGAIDNHFFNSETNADSVTVKDSTFTSNTAKNGGAIYNHGEANPSGKFGNIVVDNSKFTNNSATENGGALYNMKNGIIKIINSVFSGNTANGEKNDIYNDGQIAFEGNSTLDGGINGTGSTEVVANATVDNKDGALVQDSVSVGSGANLITNIEKLSVANGIQNDGTVTLTGSGDINTKFLGGGTLAFDTNGTIKLDDMSMIDSGMALNVIGGELAIGSNVSAVSNTLTLGNAKLNLINGVQNEISDIRIDTDKTVSLAIDFNDKINTTDSSSFTIDSCLEIDKIDISSLGASGESEISTTLGNWIDLSKDVELIKGSSSVNYIKLIKDTSSPNTAKLSAATSFLRDAIEDTATERAYQMETSETVVSDTMTGNLVVNGQGQTISSDASDLGGGINVGDGVSTASLAIIDTNVDSIKVNNENEGAFTVNGDSSLLIEAKNNDVTIKNTHGASVNNAIYLDSASGDAAVQLTANANRKLTIEDDIRSNHENNELYLSGNGEIHLNGTLDPLRVITTADRVYRNGYDEAITWDLNGGTLNYSSDKYLYDSAHHTTATLNSINFNGGSLNLMNGAVNTIKLANLGLSANSNLYVDVDLAGRTMDRFDATATVTGGKLNVAGMQLISETANNETEINFTEDANLKANVETSVTEVSSPVYKYQVSYSASDGNFKFVRTNQFNPSVFASAVAMQGAYLSQLANYDVALGNFDQQMMMTKEQRFAWKYGNKYAANDQTNPQVYSPLFIPEQESGVWFRPYTAFERVDLFNGPEVSNVMYGTLVGGDSPMMELGHGWDGQYSAYVGYNGSHQAFDGNSIYQNGGMVGLTGALYKGNFFQAFTANVGASVANIETSYGKDDLTMLSTGIASKTGYNWELAKGKFIIQPSWQMSYTFVSPMNNYSLGNVRIKNDNLNAIQLAPGLKFIGNLPHGWQPYINLRMLWNIIDDSKVKANNVNLPETTVKPYFEYGLGLQKTVGERFTGFGQMMFRNGGRTGVAFTFGFRWALGKEAKTNNK